MWKHFIVLFGGFYDPGYRSERITFCSRPLLRLVSPLPQRYVDIRHPRVQMASNRLQRVGTKTLVRALPDPDLTLLKSRPVLAAASPFCPHPTALCYMVRSLHHVRSNDDSRFIRQVATARNIPRGNVPSASSSMTPGSSSASRSTQLRACTDSRARMTLDPSLPSPLALKWEKRKTASSTHTPTARAGCTMTLWSAKGTGVMFGGVTDEERGEEGLESVFWNDLCACVWCANERD
jgi:hypothetical protein